MAKYFLVFCCGFCGSETLEWRNQVNNEVFCQKCKKTGEFVREKIQREKMEVM